MSYRLFGTLMIGVLSVSGVARCLPSATAADEIQYGVQTSLDNGVTDPVHFLPSGLEPQLAMTDDVQVDTDLVMEPVADLSNVGEQPAVEDNAAVNPSEDMNDGDGVAVVLDDTYETAVIDNGEAAIPADEQPATLTLEQIGGAIESAIVVPVMLLVNEVSDIVTAILNPETMTVDDNAEVSTADETAATTDIEPAASTDEADPTSLGDVNDPETPWFNASDLGTEMEGTLRPEMLDVLLGEPSAE